MHQQSKPIFLKIKAAALAVGIPYRTLLDAVNTGVVRHYCLGTSQKLVRIDDILAAMKRQDGEAHDED